MSDLSDFLLARIADDEGTIPFLSCECGEGVSEVDPLPTCPDRIATECESKRTLIEQVQDSWKMFPRPLWFNPDSKYAGDTPYVLRVIATVYADHPDYRQEWKP